MLKINVAFLKDWSTMKSSFLNMSSLKASIESNWKTASLLRGWTGSFAVNINRQFGSFIQQFVFCSRHQGNSIYLCCDGSRPGAFCDQVLQCRQHDRVLLWHHLTERRFSKRRLALGGLLRWCPVWHVVQQKVPRFPHQKHYRKRKQSTFSNEPAQQRSWKAGTYQKMEWNLVPLSK